MSDEAKLQILIGTKLDSAGAKAAAEGVKSIGKEAKGSSSDIQQTARTIGALEKSTESLKKSVFAIGSIGTIIGGGILKATTSYVSAANMATSTSREWQAATYQIEQSYLRLGKVGSEQVLPWLKTAADLADKAAGWAEKNPEIVKVGAAAGVIGMGAGAAATGVTLLQKIGNLLGIGGAAAGAATAAGAAGTTGGAAAGTAVAGAASGVTAGGILATVLGGLGTGLLGNELLANTEGGKAAGVQKTNVIATVVAKGMGDFFGKIFGDPDLGLKWAAGVGEATGAIQKGSGKWLREEKETSAQGSEQAGSGSNFISTSMLSSMRQMDIQERYAREDYQRTIFKSDRDFNRQRAYEQQDYDRQRMRGLRDFNISQQYTEQMFYRQRAIAQRDFQISLQRNDYDYQLSRKRSEEDYQFSLKQIMLSGDALQYYYTKRSHDIEKRRAEEDYQLQKSRSMEDFNRQQNDSMQQFMIERAQRMREFQIRREDEELDFQIRRKRSLEQYEIQLKDMEYEYQRARQRRWEAFKESILPEIQTEADYRALMQRTLTRTMINQFNSLMGEFTEGWTNISTGSDSGRSYANGGYTGSGGLSIVHPGEFVMTATTTKAAESAARGTLTQEKIIQMFSGSGEGLVYNDNRQFSRGLTAAEKQALRQETRQIVVDAFGAR